MILIKRSYIAAIGFILLLSCNKQAAPPDGSLRDTYADQFTGLSALDMLTSSNYTGIGIEVMYMPGYEPDAAVINNLQNFLDSFCNKPGGITVKTRQIPASGVATMNINDVMAAEATNRTYYNSGNNLWICVMITDCKYYQGSVLGIAYRNTSVCLFGKNINDNSGGLTQPNRVMLESTVLEHEFGHLMGLVNTAPVLAPIKSNHLDQAHDHHCTNPNCLMYYTVESTDILGWLIGSTVPVLDSACRLDLSANGGK